MIPQGIIVGALMIADTGVWSLNILRILTG
jgi:hypothetical protein